MTARCVYCGNTVDPNSPYVWHRIVAWERKSSGATRRSGSDIALRERAGPDEASCACNVCVGRLKAGIAPSQASLL